MHMYVFNTLTPVHALSNGPRLTLCQTDTEVFEGTTTELHTLMRCCRIKCTCCVGRMQCSSKERLQCGCIWFCFRVPFSYNPSEQEDYERDAQRRGISRRIHYLCRLDPRPDSRLVIQLREILPSAAREGGSVFGVTCCWNRLLTVCCVQVMPDDYMVLILVSVQGSQNCLDHHHAFCVQVVPDHVVPDDYMVCILVLAKG